MEVIITSINWLFFTREGVMCLLGGGIVLFLIIAFLLERRTKRRYFNHRKSEDDWDFFDSTDEDEA